MAPTRIGGPRVVARWTSRPVPITDGMRKYGPRIALRVVPAVVVRVGGQRDRIAVAGGHVADQPHPGQPAAEDTSTAASTAAVGPHGRAADGAPARGRAAPARQP